MPKVRILSGKQAGAVVEMSLPEAQTAYCTGYAELYLEPVVEVEAKADLKPRLSKPKADVRRPNK